MEPVSKENQNFQKSYFVPIKNISKKSECFDLLKKKRDAYAMSQWQK